MSVKQNQKSDKQGEKAGLLFWRIFLFSFIAMVIGSVCVRKELFFDIIWGPLVMYAVWNLLIAIIIFWGIRSG